MQQYAKIGKAKAGDDASKPWRLGIKRRLLKLHQEELDAVLSVKAKEEKDAAKEAAAAAAAAAPAGSSAAEEADAGPSKEDLVAARKARLEELFQELLLEYEAVLERAQK
jgi:hypothetical protein